VILGNLNLARSAVVQVGERNLVLCSDVLTNDDLVDIIELIPVIISVFDISVQRLKLGSTRDSHVEGLGREEALLVEQVEVILVSQIR